jgi:hypothetical protein
MRSMELYHRTQRGLHDDAQWTSSVQHGETSKWRPSFAQIVLLPSRPARASDSELTMPPERLQSQFNEIAEAEWKHLYRAAIRAGADPQEAEDVVKETLLHAYRTLREISVERLGRLRVHGWLTALAESNARRHVGLN